MFAVVTCLLVSTVFNTWASPSTYTLSSNGLRVIFSPDHSLPLVAVNVWYQVGSAHERSGETGLAHLFEHLMFSGSRHVPAGKHYEVLRRIGAVDTNGTTSLDRTNFFATVPNHHLETLLWLESDRMGFLELTRDAFLKRRTTALNERRAHQNAVPYGPSNERMFQTLFPAGHPYYSYLLGSPSDIEALTLERARDFHRRHYGPSNASIAIVGDFEPSKVKPMIERWFGSLPSRPAPPRRRVLTPPLIGEVVVEVREPVARARVQVAWHSPKILSRGDAVAKVLAELINQRGGGKWTARQLSLEHVSVFSVTEFSRGSSDFHALLASNRFSKIEVADASAAIRLRQLQAEQAVGFRADELNRIARFSAASGTPSRRPITPNEVEQFAAELLRAGRVVVKTEIRP